MQFTDFRDRPILFIDLEMSGLDPTEHEILEVGALVVDGKTLEIKKEYEAKVKPEHIETANKTALRLNGYHADKWEKAKPLKEVLLALNKLAPGALVAGFNVTFDWMFLEIAYRRLGIEPEFDYHKLDVLALAWAQILPDKSVKEVKLSEFCRHFGIERTEKHRALSDIKATY
ncbi:3'-5' exonuclease, partial [Candidatus Microgenomates bacterium]|nr:3'-5' exonuclease [Candidatus Microgenomates bacterium]